VLFAIFIVAGLVFIFGLEALVHRWLRSETRERVSTSTSVMIQVLAVFYSVLIAFVIEGERSAISEANDHVAAEAGAMSALFHDVGGFPPDVREPVRQAIVAYNRSVLTDDFHAVERTGQPSAQTNRKLIALYEAVQSAEPVVGTIAVGERPQRRHEGAAESQCRRRRHDSRTALLPGRRHQLRRARSGDTAEHTRARDARHAFGGACNRHRAEPCADRRPRASLQRLDRGQRSTAAGRRARVIAR
jgi:hypothetical protein